MEGEEPSAYSKEVAKGSFWSLAGSAMFYLVSFFYNIIIARAVSQDDLGLFFLSLSVTSLVAIVNDLGLSSALARYGPYYEGRREFGKIRALLRLARLAVTGAALVTIALLWWQADTIGAIYNNASLPGSIRLLSTYLLLSSLFNVNTALIRGRADMRTVQMLSNLQNFLKLALTLALFYLFGASAFTLAAAYILSFLPPMLLSVVFASRKLARLPAGYASIGMVQVASEILPYGLMASIINSLSAIIFATSRLLLGYLSDPSQATQIIAIYSVSATLATVLLTIPTSIGGIFLPIISRLYGKNNFPHIRSVTETAQRWSLFMAIPFGLVMIAFSSDMLAILYGEQYRTGALVTSLLAFGMLLKSAVVVLSLTLAAMRRMATQLLMILASGLVNISLNLMLIPQYGMAGSAIASISGFAVSVLLLAYFSKRYFGFTFAPEIYRLGLAGAATLGAVLLLSPAASALISPLGQILGPEAPFYLTKLLYLAYFGVLACMTIAVFGLIALLLKCFRKEDVALMKKAMGKAFVPPPLIDVMGKIATYGTSDPGRHRSAKPG
jgi:O-antigen/teichoic acid export membrane protein